MNAQKTRRLPSSDSKLDPPNENAERVAKNAIGPNESFLPCVKLDPIDDYEFGPPFLKQFALVESFGAAAASVRVRSSSRPDQPRTEQNFFITSRKRD